MIELLAIAGRSTHQALPEDDIERTLLNPYLSRYAHRKIHRSRNLMMMIVGDRPVSDSFYTSPAVTLVCHCDIVEPVLPGVPDAALLAQLYEKHGDSFVRLLRGWFAILLYDHKSDELKIWTDHFGVRRIIYEETQAALAAASDIRMMLPWRRKSPDIDLNAILEYLLYTCIPAPHTIYRGIKRLPPGHGLSSPTAKALAYWDMSYPEDARPRLSETDWAAAVESGIRHAVQRHLNGSAGRIAVLSQALSDR
jgi:hypothetical protein